MTGIDIPIQRLVANFTNRLWINNNCDYSGRIYDNEIIENDRVLGIRPELYDSGINYKEKLLNNNIDATTFFRITNNNIEGGTADVSIYFSVNLVKLYTNITTERADEYAINDARNIILYSEFEIKQLIRGGKAFSDYFESKQSKHDMHPYYLFRFDTELNYNTIDCDYLPN